MAAPIGGNSLLLANNYYLVSYFWRWENFIRAYLANRLKIKSSSRLSTSIKIKKEIKYKYKDKLESQ